MHPPIPCTNNYIPPKKILERNLNHRRKRKREESTGQPINHLELDTRWKQWLIIQPRMHVSFLSKLETSSMFHRKVILDGGKLNLMEGGESFLLIMSNKSSTNRFRRKLWIKEINFNKTCVFTFPLFTTVASLQIN